MICLFFPFLSEEVFLSQELFSRESCLCQKEVNVTPHSQLFISPEPPLTPVQVVHLARGFYSKAHPICPRHSAQNPVL